MLRSLVLLTCLGLCLPRGVVAGSFSVTLAADYSSVTQTLDIYRGRTGNPGDVARLRGSSIALATTALLAHQLLTPDDLERAMADAKFGQLTDDDVFQMRSAQQNVAAIDELLQEMRTRNFTRRVVATVQQLFPDDAHMTTTIPLYIVAFGHQNIDAFVRRVVWRGETPVFVGEGQGELTIVLNLAKAVTYGRNVDERFIGTLSVVAHEVFHAAFGVYCDASPLWQAYHATHTTPLDQLLALTQNEGIAHYLSFEQRTGGRVPDDWDEKVRAAIQLFNTRAEELLSPRTSAAAAAAIIRQSNTSGFWESYGAVTGLFIARTIDQRLGREALTGTVRLGPADFFGEYAALCKRDNNLPRFGERVLQRITE